MSKYSKQISLVLGLPESYNELKLFEDFNKFLLKYPEVQLTGTHTKRIEKRE
jgi:hypothetical protein